MLWSGIQGMTALHYQLKVKPGDRILLCTANVCGDLILSSLAGLFGAKLIVATHSSQAYAMFTETPPAATPAPSSASAAASSSASSLPPPLNPLAHILRVVDCSAAGAFDSDAAVLAAVMVETGGLGVDGVIDLQHSHDEWNFMHMQHVTRRKGDKITEGAEAEAEEASSAGELLTDAAAASDSATATAASAPSSSSSASLSAASQSLLSILDVNAGMLPPSSSALSSAPLIPAHPIGLAALISCLGVGGRLCTSTPNLQVDPPLSRQLFLRGASLAFLFPPSWLLGATQRGRFARQATHSTDKSTCKAQRPTNACVTADRHALARLRVGWIAASLALTDDDVCVLCPLRGV